MRPSIQLPLNHRGAAVNELKPYMRHLGIRTPPALTPGRPAFWARYVLGRLAQADGRYRRLEPRAKRAWHNLLEYNRLDCEGLREVHERATRELALWDSYRRTTFTVHGTPPIAIKDRGNPRPLRRLLARHIEGLGSELRFDRARGPSASGCGRGSSLVARRPQPHVERRVTRGE